MKDVVVYVTACHGYSERRACALTRQVRSTQRKPSVRDPRTAMRLRMHEIAQTRIRYGYRRVHIMLKREGWSGGRNLVYRLYREEGLVLRRRRPRRRKTAVNRAARHPLRVSTKRGAWTSRMTNSVMAPEVVIQPTLPADSVNQMLPSEPAVIPFGPLSGVGIMNSVTTPVVEMRPI